MMTNALLGRRRTAKCALFFVLLVGVRGSVTAQAPAPKPGLPIQAGGGAAPGSPSAAPDDQRPPTSPAAQNQTEAIAPKLWQFVEAPYPPEALKAGLQGKVEIEITIGADGKVTEARVVAGAGHGFDEAALDAVRRFVFEPARLGGQPVPSRVRYPYVFEIREPPKETPEPAAEGAIAPGRLQGRVLDRGDDRPITEADVLLTSKDGSLSGQPLVLALGACAFPR